MGQGSGDSGEDKEVKDVSAVAAGKILGKVLEMASMPAITVENINCPLGRLCGMSAVVKVARSWAVAHGGEFDVSLFEKENKEHITKQAEGTSVLIPVVYADQAAVEAARVQMIEAATVLCQWLRGEKEGGDGDSGNVG